MGSALAGWRSRHPGWFLWSAWTAAGVAGWLLSFAILEAVVLVLNLLDRVDVSLPTAAYDLIANAVLGFSVSLPQYVILRAVLGHQSGAARAWVPVTVLVLVVAEFTNLFWLHDQAQ